MGWADVEVRLEVLLPIMVALAAVVVGEDPRNNVTDVEELEELADEVGKDTAEPLAPAIEVVRIPVSPVRVPEERVLVDVRLR